jgi:hypothetical protein
LTKDDQSIHDLVPTGCFEVGPKRASRNGSKLPKLFEIEVYGVRIEIRERLRFERVVGSGAQLSNGQTDYHIAAGVCRESKSKGLVAEVPPYV